MLWNLNDNVLATVLKAPETFSARNIYFNDRMATSCFKEPWAIALTSSPCESELISVFSSGVSILKSEETTVLHSIIPDCQYGKQYIRWSVTPSHFSAHGQTGTVEWTVQRPIIRFQRNFCLKRNIFMERCLQISGSHLAFQILI